MHTPYTLCINVCAVVGLKLPLRLSTPKFTVMSAIHAVKSSIAHQSCSPKKQYQIRTESEPAKFLENCCFCDITSSKINFSVSGRIWGWNIYFGDAKMLFSSIFYPIFPILPLVRHIRAAPKHGQGKKKHAIGKIHRPAPLAFPKFWRLGQEIQSSPKAGGPNFISAPPRRGVEMPSKKRDF